MKQCLLRNKPYLSVGYYCGADDGFIVDHIGVVGRILRRAWGLALPDSHAIV